MVQVHHDEARARRWGVVVDTGMCGRSLREILQGVSIFYPGGARPPGEAMIAFIDDHREAYGVRDLHARPRRRPALSTIIRTTTS